MLSHTRMGVPYEYTHMGRPIRVWANIRIWGRTCTLHDTSKRGPHKHVMGMHCSIAVVPRKITWKNEVTV